MSTTTQLVLNLPFDFKPDNILETATPDQCAIVLITGCQALHALLNKTNELTNEQAYEKAKTEEAEKWSREKCRLEEDAKREKEKLKNTNADQVKQLEDKVSLLQNEIGSLRSSIEGKDILLNNAKKQLNELSASEIKKIEDARTETRSKMSEELNKLENALKTANDKLEKAKDDRLEAEVKYNEDKETKVAQVRKELEDKNKELHSLLLSLTGRQAGSATKGKDNEDAFAALLDKAFGPTKPYKRRDKIGNKSGDHIVEWEGMKIMIENKNYAKRVPSTEVEKAIKDFELQSDCNVLMFVSEDSTITGHERPGDLDITHTVDGRTAIWMGNFSSNEDKVTYLQMIAQFIRELGVLQTNVKQLEGDEAIENYKIRVDDLLRYFNDTKDDLDKLLKLQKQCELEQKKTWEKLKIEIISVIARFQSRQADAIGMKNNNNTTSGANADATVANDAPTNAKRKRVSKKQENTMTTYLNKQEKPTVSLEQVQSTDGASGNSSETTTSFVCID
ncbi:centromere-associated protein E-like [Daphnia magna]|uniref:centromere-associated protein E-like n=1 Tax=Daphnia magna TaxID=35525 RepID=UPI001E1BBC26|nr:centromere-associated protein E-like [Daphnia magna]